MEEIIIKTKKEKEILDITEEIRTLIREKGWERGILHLFILHTTAALTTADLDYGTDLDMLDVFEKIIPKLKFRHPHNPSHVPDHIMSSILGPSLVLPVEDKDLVLGAWQRVVLVELGGPRERTVEVSFLEIKNKNNINNI